jgi:hypothetical protein
MRFHSSDKVTDTRAIQKALFERRFAYLTGAMLPAHSQMTRTAEKLICNFPG